MIARERRHEIEERVAGGDEEEVERPEPDEEAVAHDRAVRRTLRERSLLGDARVVDDEEHTDVAEERRASSDEEHRERARVARRWRSTRRSSPPRPMPRFIVTRCCAYAACRRAGGVSRAISVDWLGQKPALPAPSIAIRTNASHGWRTSGKSAEADGLQHEPGAEDRPRRRSGRRAGRRRGRRSSCAAAETETTSPEMPSPNPRTSWR